jgi:sugar/nucleoside kinase (ribokinase family)
MPDRAPRIAGAGLLALDVILAESGGPEALTFAGGTCGNVLSILSFLHWTATPVGFIGDDAAGRRVLADLTSSGVRSAHLVQCEQWSTPVFIQRLERDDAGRPRHSFSNVSGSHCPHCGHPIRKSRTRAKPGTTPIKHFTGPEPLDVFFMDRLSADILSLAESARARGALVFYEPSAKEDARHWDDAFELIDIVKYSADRFESEELAPFVTRKARRDLWEVQTLGARGLKYRRHTAHDTDALRWINSAAIAATRVIDTCGAGDWCSAGILHGLIASQQKQTPATFAKALRLGQLLAAWACAFVGARGAMYCNDRGASAQAIKSLLDGRKLDLARLPTAASSAPQAQGGLRSCVADLCET